MSGQWIYSSRDDLGLLNGIAFLLLSLALPFSTQAAVFRGFISAESWSWRDDSPTGNPQIDLNCKVSMLVPMPGLDWRQGVSILNSWIDTR